MAKKDPINEPKDITPEMGAPKKESKEEERFKGAPNIAVLQGWLQFAKSASEKKHWDFFVIDQMLKGNHNVRGNPNDNTIEVTKKADSINYPINKLFATFRAVRAFVTRHKPVAEVEPDNSTPEAKTYARRANAALERDNKLNNGRRLNKEWVYYGVKYGIGWRQIGYDTAKKVSMRWTIDPFDLLIGSMTGKAEDAPYLIKCVVRTVGYWKNKYPKANVVPDNLTAEDEYKRLAIEMEYQSTSANAQSEDEQTAIGYECWYRTFNPNKQGGLINKCLFTKTEIVDFEETPYEEYPFIPYESEVTPNAVYPDGHLKHTIAPQRMLNLLNTQKLEYNHIINRGRLLMDKNSGLEVVQAKEGQIIKVNPGKRVQFLNPPPQGTSVDTQIEKSEQYIEDIGGQHDASAGQLPSSSISGDAIEALQNGDSNNISDLRDNFEDALAQEAAWILKMYSLYETEGVVLNETVDGEENQFGMVGEAAYKTLGKKIPDKYYMEANGTYSDIMAILPDNQVKVSVSSQLGETKQARLNLLFKLVEAGLPLKFVLQYLEFPNTTDILERIAEESVAEIMMQQMQTTPPPGSATMTGAPTPVPPVPASLAPVSPELSMKLEQLKARLGGQR